jgi:hypothetical protein
MKEDLAPKFSAAVKSTSLLPFLCVYNSWKLAIDRAVALVIAGGAFVQGNSEPPKLLHTEIFTLETE